MFFQGEIQKEYAVSSKTYIMVWKDIQARSFQIFCCPYYSSVDFRYCLLKLFLSICCSYIDRYRRQFTRNKSQYQNKGHYTPSPILRKLSLGIMGIAILTHVEILHWEKLPLLFYESSDMSDRQQTQVQLACLIL